MMPGMDGFQFIARIREMSDAHVLVLTAYDSEEYLVQGLSLGADEFLVKPVSRRELLARVRALLRRGSRADESPSSYSDSALKVNFLTHEVEVRGRSVALRPTEFRLLAYLCQSLDRVTGHDELLDRVWGDERGSQDSLKWYIHSLREKMEVDSHNPTLILTVPGVGYRYRPPAPDQSRVPGSGVRGRGSGERETTASSLAGKEESSRKEDNSGQGKDGPAGAIAQGGNGR